MKKEAVNLAGRRLVGQIKWRVAGRTGVQEVGE